MVTKLELEFIVDEVRESVKEVKQDLKESKDVVNDTKDTLIRIETLMGNVVTVPAQYEAFKTHVKEEHKPKRKLNIPVYGGVGAGALVVLYSIFKFVSMKLGL